MKNLSVAALFFVALTVAPLAQTTTTTLRRLVYPDAHRSSQVDDYHGVKVADPYRWLEDTDSAETRAWVTDEQRLTQSFLDQIPQRPRIKDRLTHLWNFERFGIPFHEGGRYFFFKNNGLQSQSVLYVTQSLSARERMLLDPNLFSKTGTVALNGYAVSDDGKWLAYGISVAGSDWTEFRVRNTDNGQDLPDRLQWVKFSDCSWTKDNQGFFYSRYDEPTGNKMAATNYYQKLYYHRLGTAQAQDVLVYKRDDQKEWGFSGNVSEDGRWLIINVSKGTDEKNLVYYKDLNAAGLSVSSPYGIGALIGRFEASYDFIGNDGPKFWFRTNHNAPRGRIVAIDVRQPAVEKEVVAQTEDTLRGASLVGDRFVGEYLHDAHTRVRMFAIDGQPQPDLSLPAMGTASGFGGKRHERETFYSFTSYTVPTTIYRYDFQSGQSSVFRRPKMDFDPSQYTTEQVFYRSKDGTRIPMFLSYKKGLKQDGHNPTYLYGYGGFNIAITPSFSVANLVWMEMGGVLAVANLRGGGEYGEEWHQAGMKLHKQNVFDDFIAAAEWLISNHWTDTPHLAIGGRSNGGLLIGAALTQRPDLFGAAVPGVGVMDMLRFQKFTIGWAWTSDYGSSDDPQEFKALYAYSPLHNIRAGTTYPPTLVITADHDDRVVPGHSFKFAATLQAAQGGAAPILIRIESQAGHGAGKPTAKIIDEYTDMWAFLVGSLGMHPPTF